MRIAIVHDWLTVYAGAERCLEQILACFPDAELFALVDFLDESERGFLQGKTVQMSFLQTMPFARKRYRSYLPLMPIAIEQIDLSGFDIVISSTHAVAKGVLVGPDQLHLSYVYSPIRYAWDLQFQYLAESGLTRGIRSWLARWLLHKIRLWDYRTSAGVDSFVGISHFVARRIEKVYRRDAHVIYPPVDATGFAFREAKEDFYVTASRMVPYKKMATIIEAFALLPDKKLVVIGAGPDFEKCRAAAGPNVTLMGWQPYDVLRDHLQRAKAFIFAAEEDFGIAPLEAQACGTPVIAFGKGGVRETLQGLDCADPTAVFFDSQTPLAIADAVRHFELYGSKITPDACRANALRFSAVRFRTEFSAFVAAEWQKWEAKKRIGNRNQVAE